MPRPNHNHYPGYKPWRPWGYVAWPVAIAAGLWAMNATGGNHHGASKTDADTMPSFAVPQLAPESSSPAFEGHNTTSGFVCSTSVLIDADRGEIIVRPITVGPNTERPVNLGGVAASGATVYGPLPRVNPYIYNTNGSEDKNQRLDGCTEMTFRVVSVEGEDGSEYRLVENSSDVQNGDDAPDGDAADRLMGAIRGGYVHHAEKNLTSADIANFRRQIA